MQTLTMQYLGAWCDQDGNIMVTRTYDDFDTAYSVYCREGAAMSAEWLTNCQWRGVITLKDLAERVK